MPTRNPNAWRISAEIEPGWDGGALQNDFVKGGIFIFKTKTQRNNLGYDYRQLDPGSITTLAYVMADKVLYELLNNPSDRDLVDADWNALTLGATSSVKPIGEWDAITGFVVGTATQLLDTGALGLNGNYYIVMNSPGGTTHTWTGLFRSQSVTVYNGDWVISVGGYFAVVRPTVTWDTLNVPDVITEYVAGQVISHPHLISDIWLESGHITSLQSILDSKYDSTDLANYLLPYGSAPDGSLMSKIFMDTYFYTKSDVYNKSEIASLIAINAGNGLSVNAGVIELGGSNLSHATTIIGNNYNYLFENVDPATHYRIQEKINPGVFTVLARVMTETASRYQLEVHPNYTHFQRYNPANGTVWQELGIDSTLGIYFYDPKNSFGVSYIDDYGAAGRANPRWIPDWGSVKGYLAGKVVSAIMQAPTVTQSGYVIFWDNTNSRYDLKAATGSAPGGTSAEIQTNNGSGGFGGSKIYTIGDGNFTIGTGLAGDNRTFQAFGTAADVGIILAVKGVGTVFANSQNLVVQSGIGTTPKLVATNLGVVGSGAYSSYLQLEGGSSTGNNRAYVRFGAYVYNNANGAEKSSAVIRVRSAGDIDVFRANYDRSITLYEVANPSDPADPVSGEGRMWIDTSGHLQFENDSGTIYDLTAGGGGGGWNLSGNTTLTGNVSITSTHDILFESDTQVVLEYGTRISIIAGPAGVVLASTLSGETVSFSLRDDAHGTHFTDNRTVKVGIEYNADYSATFTARSLVDKGYVDAHIISPAGSVSELQKNSGGGGFSATKLFSTVNGSIVLGDSSLAADRNISVAGSAADVNLSISLKGAGSLAVNSTSTPITSIVANSTGAGIYMHLIPGAPALGDKLKWYWGMNLPIAGETTVLEESVETHADGEQFLIYHKKWTGAGGSLNDFIYIDGRFETTVMGCYTDIDVSKHFMTAFGYDTVVHADYAVAYARGAVYGSHGIAIGGLLTIVDNTYGGAFGTMTRASADYGWVMGSGGGYYLKNKISKSFLFGANGESILHMTSDQTNGNSLNLYGKTVHGVADAGGSSTILIDAAGGFTGYSDLVAGCRMVNEDDGSEAVVVTVNSATQVTTTALTGGSSNTWGNNDHYTFYTKSGKLRNNKGNLEISKDNGSTFSEVASVSNSIAYSVALG